MERHFDDELSRFNNELIKMGALAEDAIYASIEALKDRDKNRAQQVIAHDVQVDEKENAIEEMAINLLALRQPMAFDLRFVATGMKINAELERIADLAVNISQRVLELADKPLLKPLIDIPKLSVLARTMVHGAIDAFIERNEKKAQDVIVSDTEADALRNAIQQELIYQYMAKDGTSVSRAVPLLLVTRHLERICDHATNIAEDVIYMVKAEVVKHHPERLERNKT